MKTFKTILISVLVFVFIANTIEAQTVVSTEVFTVGDYESSDVSDNRNYVSIVVINIGPTNDEGIVKTLEKQTNGTFTLVNEYDLLKGIEYSASVQGVRLSTSNTGVNYSDYVYDNPGDDVLVRLQKNMPDGSTVTIFEYVNDGVATMKAIDDDLYTIFGVGANFDPGTLGNLPNLSNGYHLLKVDGTNNQYDWSVPLGSSFVWSSDVEFIVNPVDADNVYLTTATGDLIKFRKSDGVNLGTIMTGSEGDKYKFDEEGNLHRLITSEHKLIIYDGSDNYSVLYETDWMQYNLWETNPIDWKISNGLFYGIGSGKVLHLSDKLIHGYISKMYQGYNGTLHKVWVNNDDSDGYIDVDGSTITILTVEEDTENESLIPTLNDSDPNIVAVVDGQTYDGTNWNEAYHQGTIVFADGTLPNIGDTPDNSWVDAAPGTWKVVTFPVEESNRDNENLIFRVVCRKDNTANHDINLKVILKEESEVVLDVKNISESEISVYPNPVKDILNISGVTGLKSVEVYDVSGRIVAQNTDAQNIYGFALSEAVDNGNTINVSKLNSGIYFIKIQTKLGLFVGRFVKE